MKPSLTAVIADDHSIARNGLRAVLESIDGVSVVAEATNGVEAISLATSKRPTVLTLDVSMPLSGGMEVYGEVRRWSPDTRIVVVTGFAAAGHLAGWLDVGADGLFLKSCALPDLRAGLEAVLRGDTFVDPAILDILGSQDQHERLTLRERQILHLITTGLTNAQVADRLSISPKTVDNHRTRMMSKLGVRSLGQLIAYALREGLLDSVAQHEAARTRSAGVANGQTD